MRPCGPCRSLRAVIGLRRSSHIVKRVNRLAELFIPEAHEPQTLDDVERDVAADDCDGEPRPPWQFLVQVVVWVEQFHCVLDQLHFWLRNPKVAHVQAGLRSQSIEIWLPRRF